MTRIRVALMLWTLVLVTSPSFAQGGEEVVYFHSDAVGSVRLVTDANGQVVERYDYLPFGEPYPPSAPVVETRRFGGKERDNETGLDYFGARYYASANGRFTTVDPGHVAGSLYNPQTWNAYAYALNNPLRFVDPFGLAPCPPPTDTSACVEGRAGTGEVAFDLVRWQRIVVLELLELENAARRGHGRRSLCPADFQRRWAIRGFDSKCQSAS